MELGPFDQVEPVDLRWNTDGTVGITWDDTHESRFDLAYLRSRCPCATCKGTHGAPTTLVRTSRAGLPILTESSRPPEPSVQVRAVEPVGRYAIRFTWADGHDTGLYSFRYLRVICPCAACETDRTAQA